MKKVFLSLLLIILTSTFSRHMSVYAVKTGPQYFLYEGQLLTPMGEAFTGEFEFRFSLWKNADFKETDLTDNFLINTEAEDFLGWEERQIKQITQNGAFSIKVGSIYSFPEEAFKNPNVFLQVEIKYRTDKDDKFELIDSDTVNVGYDRMILSSIPFSQNADKLDFRDAGYDAGNIPYLDDEGKLPRALIDAGFGAGDIPYLNEEGKLPNGIIEVGVEPGDIPVLDEEGLIPIDLLPNLMVEEEDIIVGTIGEKFTIDSLGSAEETDSLSLRFGKFLAKNLSWNGLLQRFIFNDDLEVEGDLVVDGKVQIEGITFGKQERTKILSPHYPGAIFDGDGTNNSGSMYEEEKLEIGNVLRWTTERDEIQDYDIVIHYQLPQDFVSFVDDNQISLKFKTMGEVTNSSINFQLKKEGDATIDEFSGSGMSLTSVDWNELNFTLADKEKWQEGDKLLLKIKMFASKNFDVSVSDIKIRTISK